MTAPVVLHLSNERALGPELGFGGDFRDLASDALVSYVPVAPLALLAQGREQALREVARIGEEARPDLVFLQSPNNFPWSSEDVTRLLRRLGSPPVIYWEGDPWGGRKPLSESSRAWLRYADTVFSVGLGAQAALLGRYTRHPVRYICHTVPAHLSAPEPVPPMGQAVHDVVHIGGCHMRFGLFEGVDGARERRRLVRRLCRLPDCRVAVYGPGWRGPNALGPLPFTEQVHALRRSRLSASWEHFRDRYGYFSDRLPISLYAGRPHVTCRPPGVTWLPGPEQGLHLVDSIDEAMARVRDLVRIDPAELYATGLAANRWVRSRLTSLNALRHMLRSHLAVLPPPPADPWEAIAAMDGLVPSASHRSLEPGRTATT
jgi:sugar phosphate isomerase/epimerase